MRFPQIPVVVPAWILAFIVVGLIAHSIWSASDHMYQGREESRAEEEIRAVISGFRNLYAGHSTGTAGENLVPIAISTGICSHDMVVADVAAYCQGPWGKDNWILITNNAGLRFFDGSINIYITGLNQEACNGLGALFATSDAGLLHASVNSTEVFLTGPDKKPPFTAADIQKACNRRGTANTLLITTNL